jgi:hypothetical protein
MTTPSQKKLLTSQFAHMKGGKECARETPLREDDM